VRDAEGNPTGHVLEVAVALSMVNKIGPISVEAMAEPLEGWLPKAAAAGITSIYAARVPPVGDDRVRSSRSTTI